MPAQTPMSAHGSSHKTYENSVTAGMPSALKRSRPLLPGKRKPVWSERVRRGSPAAGGVAVSRSLMLMSQSAVGLLSELRGQDGQGQAKSQAKVPEQSGLGWGGRSGVPATWMRPAQSPHPSGPFCQRSCQQQGKHCCRKSKRQSLSPLHTHKVPFKFAQADPSTRRCRSADQDPVRDPCITRDPYHRPYRRHWRKSLQ